MTLQQQQSLLIVGPDPGQNALGGVARHIQILRSLDALKNAMLFDPGSIQGKPGIAAAGILVNFLRLKRQITKRRYSQVWINTSIYPLAFLKLLVMLAVLRKTTPTIKRVFFHGGRFEELRFLRAPLIRLIAETILKEVYTFHFLSEDQGKGFGSLFPKLNSQPFRNYLPQNESLPQHPDGGTKIFLFVGRMVRTKGIFDILSAADFLRKADLNKIQFWFVGDGEDLTALESAAASHPSAATRILGRQTPSTLNSIYARAFALVLPSYHREGLPYVIIEALRAGLPIIATAQGAISEFITSGENGYLIRPRDPKGVGAAICHLLENPNCAKTIEARNRRLFHQLFSKSAAESYYTQLLQGG
jgi:glycosyltransferase involved in cell wall biosynthesis